ncbi:hypothetical protein BSL78_16437 [Apostichopus japonicus]|uniref:Uncharacterized protein n=1 Tax=Stichopus japonicus TaxID=307972 RepID=A0A2G8KFF7_STIJA|nr:hypothetical protein BSL78_16437 [Apostichopus japonicus]
MIFIIGDFTAKVDCDNEGMADIMGKGGIGVTDDNGERLCKWKSTSATVKDKDGNIIKDKQARKDRWKDHFRSVLNRGDPLNWVRETDERIEAEVKIDLGVITRLEVHDALIKTNNDFEKVFDSLHSNSLWNIWKEYQIPDKIIRIVKALYNNVECAVVDEDATTEWFHVTSTVKQGCVKSGFLFLLAIDWVMKRVLSGERRGIRWRFTT